MEEGGVVSKLASLGARIAKGGVLFVERPNLYRVTDWLRERGMTWIQVPGYAIDEAVRLGEMDPASLVNSILFDPEHAYSWEKREEQEWYPDANDIEFAKERNVVRTPDMSKLLDLDTQAFTKLNKQAESFDRIFEEVLAEFARADQRYDCKECGKRVTQAFWRQGKGPMCLDCNNKLPEPRLKLPKNYGNEKWRKNEGALDHGWQDDDTTDHPRTESSDPEGEFYEDLRVKLARVRKMKEASARTMLEEASSSSASSDSSESSSSSTSLETPDSKSSEEEDGLAGVSEKSQAGTYSTDPSFNPCALYLRAFCRVDGRPCLYRKDTYRDCPKRGTGLKCAKEALAIPPGEENNKALNKPVMGS